ncbi:MAG TPA: type II secretion system F family protein, partial [Candidatus Methylomirabilis sp.]
MQIFHCTLGTASGAVLREERQADTAEALRDQLEGQGYYIFEIAPQRPAARLRALGPAVAFRRVRPKDLLVFTQELVALTRAGLPIPMSLDLLAERTHQPRLRHALAMVREQVKAGAALSGALEGQADVFPPTLVASVRAGERSGALGDALARHIIVLKQLVALRRRVMNALTYPLVLLLLSLGVVTFLITYVVPSFSAIYEDLGRAIPPPTRALLATAAAARAHWLLVLAAAAAAAAAARYGVQTEAGRLLRDRTLLGVPWAGEVMRRYALTQFCRTLAMVLGGGIPMMQALPVAVGAVENRHIQRRLQAVAPVVAAGTPLAAALEGTAAAPGLAVEMLAVGEQTGNLEDMLTNVADFFAEEVETRLA